MLMGIWKEIMKLFICSAIQILACANQHIWFLKCDKQGIQWIVIKLLETEI